MPVRTAAMCGALVIDSIPPATTTLAEPALIRSWPSMIAFMPEPHTLLSVVQPVEGGSPAASAAWRAGAWPRFAGSTQPISTSPTSPGAIPDCCSAALMAAAPSLGVGKPVNWPRNAPMGVRLAAAMTMSDMSGLQIFKLSRNAARGRLCELSRAAKAASARMSALSQNYGGDAALPQTPRLACRNTWVQNASWTTGAGKTQWRRRDAQVGKNRVDRSGGACLGLGRLRRRGQ